MKPATAIRMTPEGLTIDGAPVKTTPTAIRHLCQLAKIPPDFFVNRMTSDEQSTVFNRLYGELGGVEKLYRVSGNTLYAVVSNRYVPRDNILLVDILRQAAESALKLKPVKSYIHPDFTKIRLIPSDAKANDLIPMIEFTNSEVGYGSLRILAGSYRLECTNGLITEIHSSRARWIHIGKGDVSVPDLGAVFTQATELTAAFNRTKRVYLDAGRKSEILLGVSNALGPKVAEVVVKIANESYNGGRTLADIVNSITEAAQLYQPAAQTEIEKHAARIVVSN